MMFPKLWKTQKGRKAPWIFLQPPGSLFEEQLFERLASLYPPSKVFPSLLTPKQLREPKRFDDCELLRAWIPLSRLRQSFPYSHYILCLRDPVSYTLNSFLNERDSTEFESWTGSVEKPGYLTNPVTRLLAGPEWVSCPGDSTPLDDRWHKTAIALLDDFPGLLLCADNPLSCWNRVAEVFPQLSDAPSNLEGTCRDLSGLLNSSTRARILKQNSYDSALHARAVELHGSHQELGNVVQRHLLQAGQNLQVEGCYDLETFHDGRCFFWTGAEAEARILVPVRFEPRSKVRVRLNTLTKIHPSALEELEVSLGGEKLDCEQVDSAGNLWVGTTQVSDRLVGSSPPHVMTLSGPAHTSDTDERKLGLALCSVELEYRGFLREEGASRQFLPIGPLMASLARLRDPRSESADNDQYRNVLELVLTALWENQELQRETLSKFNSELSCLREVWEESHSAQHPASLALTSQLQERLAYIEEFLDP